MTPRKKKEDLAKNWKPDPQCVKLGHEYRVSPWKSIFADEGARNCIHCGELEGDDDDA